MASLPQTPNQRPAVRRHPHDSIVKSVLIHLACSAAHCRDQPILPILQRTHGCHGAHSSFQPAHCWHSIHLLYRMRSRVKSGRSTCHALGSLLEHVSKARMLATTMATSKRDVGAKPPNAPKPPSRWASPHADNVPGACTLLSTRLPLKGFARFWLGLGFSSIR